FMMDNFGGAENMSVLFSKRPILKTFSFGRRFNKVSKTESIVTNKIALSNRIGNHFLESDK
ncbi:MAG: hypothetical protein ACE5FF_13045, partial [Saprospiraceae bacterium]